VNIKGKVLELHDEVDMNFEYNIAAKFPYQMSGNIQQTFVLVSFSINEYFLEWK
jgi:ABC-type microcin C transport system duplicated ATPase subunit YejF